MDLLSVLEDEIKEHETTHQEGSRHAEYRRVVMTITKNM